MKIVVGMSGGVDSAVAAHLLKEEGHDVTGVFMNNWAEPDDGFCRAEQDFNDVKRICGALNIPYYSVNFSKEYYGRVFRHFLDEYAAGRTPNPDVLCNREIKFGTFAAFARGLGAERIATGHYAGVEYSDGRYRLIRAADECKDQTYFLNQLSQEQLAYAIFPLANLKKDQVRQIARARGIPVYAKKDSTGICFIGERKFKEFLENYLPAQPGDVMDEAGKVLGRHDGLMYYTLGQRRGLNIGGVSGSEGRWFVLGKDLASNSLTVSCRESEALYSSGLTCAAFNFIEGALEQGEYRLQARLRHRQPLFGVTAAIQGNSVTLRYTPKQRAATPGQYAALYNGKYCLGGGIITKTYP